MNFMSNNFECELVSKKLPGSVKIEAKEIEKFIVQYRSAIAETKGVTGVVYILKTERPIPRIKGASEVLYIGETKHDVWSRYYAEEDANDFWSVYSHSLENYGAIYLDVYQTSNNKVTEKKFLQQYYQTYLELPPINSRG
jgi:hypothetical protein